MPWTKIKAELVEPDFHEEAEGRILAYPEAVREALSQALSLDPGVFVMGQGVDDPSGMFGTTKNLHLEFGPERVFDTPLAETALTGIAVGAALAGMRPVYFHNRPDFLTLAFDQLVNHAAKWRFMFGGKSCVPLTIWACIGRGWGSAAQHSQALQGLFAAVPGLKVVMPSTVHDAKGLMLAAIKDQNPVVILDHRLNFRMKGRVPEAPYTIPLGKAAVRRAGKDLTIVATGYLAAEAYTVAEKLAKDGVDAEVIDLRTLRPLDEETILASVRKTGRLLATDCGWTTGGFAAEVLALVAEKAFPSLKTAPLRVCGLDLPTPAGCTLERDYYLKPEDIEAAVKGLLAR